MLYVIVTGGPIADQASALIKSLAENSEDSVIIGCDSGVDYLAKFNIIPDMVVGDMDSITSNGLEFIKNNNIFVEKYPVEKDWTDSEIALGKTDKDDVILVCPVSGRLDHVIANLQLVLKLKSEGKDIAVTDGITCVYPLFGKDKVEVDVTPYSGNAAVSLIPWNFNEPVTGVTTKGLYYALKDADLDAGSTFSFSNKPRKNADKITVSIKSGMLLVTVTNAI